MQTLFYNIGAHSFELVAGSLHEAYRSLPSYVPFCTNHHKTENANLLFSLKTNKKIDIPNDIVIDEVQREDLVSTIYQDGVDTYILAKRGNIIYKLKANKDWTILETDLGFKSDDEPAFFYHFLTTAYGMASAPYKTIKVHASVIEKNGKALLFIAPSGTGKSTHSRLWLQHVPGAELLNDDEPIVRVQNNKVIVYGAPWSGSTPCYRNASAEVAAIVHLYQSPENKLAQLDTVSAVTHLMKQCSVLRSDPDNKKFITETVFDIVSKIPVYRLDCRPDREAVSLTETLMK